MEGRPAVEELVRRVRAGASIDDAADGLDLGWDMHGLHASEYLLHGVVWAGLDDAKYVALVDWFLARGADGGRLLATGLEDRGALGRIPPMVEHLLTRRPLPDLAPALRTAFRLRRETMARRLLALGADVGVLAPWVRADLVTPASVEVRYRASAEEQRVAFSIRFLALRARSFAGYPEVQARTQRLVRLGASGLLGSDLFDPAASHVAEESPQIVEHRESGTWEATSTLRVKGVAPAGLALVLRWLVGADADLFPIAIRFVGELAPNGDACSVDDARALAWFRGPENDPIAPPASLPFPITVKPKKKCFAIVEHDANAAASLSTATSAIEEPLELCATRVGWDSDTPPMAELLDTRTTPTRTEIVLKRYLAGRTTPPRAPLRALVLAAAAACGGATSLRWADDAEVSADVARPPEAPIPVPKKRTPKPSTKRATTIAVDRRPSRIGELRRLARTLDGLPWSASGAPSTAPPSSLGGAPLPPTLREWLEGADAPWPVPRRGPFEPRTFTELVREQEPALAEIFGGLEEHLLPGPCVPLFVPSLCTDHTVLFLYLPLVDDASEPPVLGFDPTDEGLVGVFAARFDDYLARVLGVDAYPYAFGPVPGADAHAHALLAGLPAAQRKRVRLVEGYLPVGRLIAG